MEIKNWGRTCPRKKNFDPAVEIRDGKQPKQQRKLVEKKLEKKTRKKTRSTRSTMKFPSVRPYIPISVESQSKESSD